MGSYQSLFDIMTLFLFINNIFIQVRTVSTFNNDFIFIYLNYLPEILLIGE